MFAVVVLTAPLLPINWTRCTRSFPGNWNSSHLGCSHQSAITHTHTERTDIVRVLHKMNHSFFSSCRSLLIEGNAAKLYKFINNVDACVWFRLRCMTGAIIIDECVSVLFEDRRAVAVLESDINKSVCAMATTFNDFCDAHWILSLWCWFCSLTVSLETSMNGQ
jgi:hypothetical protein